YHDATCATRRNPGVRTRFSICRPSPYHLAMPPSSCYPTDSPEGDSPLATALATHSGRIISAGEREPQRIGAAARQMHLVARDAERRAHRAGVELAAVPVVVAH